MEFSRYLILGVDKFEICKILQNDIPSFLNSISTNPEEIKLFNRLLESNISELSVDEISSGGYVLHTIEASIWCLLTTENYQNAVLKAVNLGDDTDTTTAVTGGLAGLLYGFETIPKTWLNQLARKDDIEDLAERFAEKIIFDRN